MADLVYMANAALDRIGQAQIISLDDQTPSARKAKLHIYECIRQVLRAGKWKSATKQATPAQLTDTPLFQWTYAYQLPDDFIRMSSVVATDGPAGFPPAVDGPTFDGAYVVPNYAIQGRTLLTNDNVIQVNYVADLTMGTNDVNVTDALLTELFILNLSATLCWPFQQSRTLRESLLQEYAVKLRVTRATDAQDSHDPLVNRLHDSEWLRERITSTNG